MIRNENIAIKAIEAGGKLSVKSALNPILWLCAIITIPGLVISAFFNPVPIWLIVLILLPVSAAILGFLFLLILDRDKLQSEDYQLKKRSMEIIQDKGDLKPMLVDAEEVEAIEEPKGEEGQQ